MAPEHRHYDTQDYAGDRAARRHRTMLHVPAEDRADLQHSITGSQAAELTPDVRMGDDRALGDTPNWAGFDSEQLYAFATQDNSPATADDLGRVFTAGGNSLAEAANALLDAVTRLDGAWRGVAADSARAALAPLALAAGRAGQTAQLMGVQMSRQSLAATEVRRLPPAQKFDQKQALDAMLAGGPAAMQADLKARKEAADAVKREQVSYLNAYTQAMRAVDARTPSFLPPPAGRIDPGRAGGTMITVGPVAYSDAAGGLGHGAATGAPSGGGVTPDAGTGGPGGPGGELSRTGTPGTTAAGDVPGSTTLLASTTTPGGGAAQLAAPSAGTIGFGGAFGGAAGGGVAFGGTGPGGATRGGAGARGPAAFGVPGQGVAGRGATPTGPPGGRRTDEDDDERGRPSYLIEGDPEGTFGSGQLAAPSVIGGDEDD